MKKAIATILALALLFSAAPAFAANETTGESTITYDLTAPSFPNYTITIPANIELAKDGTDVEIAADDVNNLNGGKISVTVAGTGITGNYFYLKAIRANGVSHIIRYDLTSASGEQLIYHPIMNEHVGKELVSFTDNGADTFNIKLQSDETPVDGLKYTGTLIYGIAVVNA